ncbi:NADP-dependent oxidoreductase domain-containing protein [Melanogaster broomeanus]|nr:NADP-dependent oxidoreductase domain-containing protein [Melanogaster broomeanus]
MPPSTIALNDGTQAPWIAFGTGSALSGQDVSKPVALAIKNGFTHLDGAQKYKNEASLGAGIVASRKPRSQLYITTKLDALPPGATPQSALQESLRKLGVDYVDQYLVHLPTDHGDLQEVWRGMEEAQRSGLTESIGVSNFQPHHLEEILEVATIIPAVNQVRKFLLAVANKSLIRVSTQIEAHPYVWVDLKENLALHKEYNIVTSSYAGLTPIVRVENGPLDPVIEKIRARLQSTRGSPVSDSQVLIKWLKQNDVLVVTTSSKAERLRGYLDTENLPDLTEEEMDLIETTGATFYKRAFPGTWPQY